MRAPGFRPVLRVLLIAALAYPLTAAAAAPSDSDDFPYGDYMTGPTSGDPCGLQSPASSGGWICSYDPSP